MQTRWSPESRWYRRATWVAALVLFGLTYALAVWWHRLGIFGPPLDYLFDSDTSSNLRAISVGVPQYERSHPLFEACRIPVWLVSGPLSWISGRPFEAVARTVGLAVSPAAAAGALVVTHALLERVGVHPQAAFWLSLGFATWNTNLVFSTMPETYPLSRLLLTTALWAIAAGAIPRRPGATWALGVGWTGVTVTNVAPYAAFLWARRATADRRADEPWLTAWRRTLPRELLRALVILASTFGLRGLWLLLSQDVGGPPDYILFYVANSLRRLASNFLQLVEMFTVSIVSPLPDISPWMGVTYRHSPSLEAVPLYLGGLLVVALCIRGLTRPELPDWLKAACVLNTVYNLALHTVFGIEGFLYTQHWATTTFLMLVPLMTRAPRATVVVMVPVVILNLLNLYRIPMLLPVGLVQ